MNVNNMMDRLVTLTNLDNLADDPILMLYYLNIAKLSLQRRYRFRYNEFTTSINLIPLTREYNAPSNYLRTVALRRPRPTRDFNNDAQLQFLNKYTDKISFEHDYPTEDEMDNISTGVANAFIIYGPTILIGHTPNQAEVLKFDYHGKLPDYDEVNYVEDAFSIFAYDALIAGALEEVYSTFVYNAEKLSIWSKKKIQRENELTILQVSEEMSSSQRHFEVFG